MLEMARVPGECDAMTDTTRGRHPPSPSPQQGQPGLSKRISVNDPFRFNGITLYQTDWSLAAVTLRVVPPGSSVPAPATPSTASSDSSSTASGSAFVGSSEASAVTSPGGAAAAAASSVLPPSAPSSSSSSPSAASSSPPSSSSAKAMSSPTTSNEPFNLPLASLEGKPGIAGRLWGSFLPLSAPGLDGAAPRGVSGAQKQLL